MDCLNFYKPAPGYNSLYSEPAFVRKPKYKKNANAKLFPIQCKHHMFSIISKPEFESDYIKRQHSAVSLAPHVNYKYFEEPMTYNTESCIYQSQECADDQFSNNHYHRAMKHNQCRHGLVQSCYPQNHESHLEPRMSYQEDLVKRGLLVKGSLGSGSYSKVKKAIDAQLNFSEVAIKIIDKRHATKEYLERFLPREINIWVRLCHPNLIKLIDYFEENMRVYMVLEYAPGGDALNYIQKKGPLNENQAKCWFDQIVSALSYMHNRNVAHRDLKLENLLLFDNCNCIKLGDFGFVKDVYPNNCLSDTFCGSKAYAAPEILSGQTYDPKKGDVWALGVVLFIILTGKMPFNETRGIKNVLEEQATLNLGELHPPFHDIILKAFTWNVLLRPDIDSLQLDSWANCQHQE